MYQILSYPIKKGQPTWPGNPAFSLEPHTSIAGGDTANTCTIHLFNHYGTHLDGPMHFYGKGIPLDQVPFGHFFFHKPLLLDIPKEPGAKLMPEDLIPHREDVKDADLLLIRTGFSKYRREKPDLYENNGPAVSSRLARYLQDNMSHLKALAFLQVVRGDKRHIVALVNGLGRLVNEDDGNARVLGVLEHRSQG